MSRSLDFFMSIVGVSEDQFEVASPLFGFIVFFTAAAPGAGYVIACAVALLAGFNWDAVQFVVVQFVISFLWFWLGAKAYPRG